MRYRTHIKTIGLSILLFLLAIVHGYAQQPAAGHSHELSTQKKDSKLSLVRLSTSASIVVNHAEELTPPVFPPIACRYNSDFRLRYIIDFDRKFRNALLLIYPFETFW